MQSDRRRAPRYPLIAAAEVIDLGTDTHFKARTSDLSLVGCYLDTLNPLPVGTEVKVQITHQGKIFTALGTVDYSQPNMGMGVCFSVIDSDQQIILRKWLTGLSRSRTGDADGCQD